MIRIAIRRGVRLRVGSRDNAMLPENKRKVVGSREEEKGSAESERDVGGAVGSAARP